MGIVKINNSIELVAIAFSFFGLANDDTTYKISKSQSIPDWVAIAHLYKLMPDKISTNKIDVFFKFGYNYPLFLHK